MYKGKKILAVIPARGGSKGVPRKNIKDLGGKPLIAWTIECAKKSKYLDRVIVSTEDNEIASVAQKWGAEVPFMRPKELAQDDTPGVMPVVHAVKMLAQEGYNYIVLLQVTSPFRMPKDIDSAIEKCVDRGADTCVSLTEAEASPYWMFSLSESEKLQPLLEIDIDANYQRQKLPVVYQLNGAVYVVEISYLLREHRLIDGNTLGYVMSAEHSLDIDTLRDFSVAESMLKLGDLSLNCG